MTIEQLIFESLKLAAQIIAAVAVGWLAVRWALRRYKSEKLWERRLAAYCDLTTALGEMYRLNQQWIGDIEDSRMMPSEESERRYERYRLAHLKFDEVASVARLILPQSGQNQIARYEIAMARRPDFTTRYVALEHDAIVIAETMEAVVRNGREVLSVDLIDRRG